MKKNGYVLKALSVVLCLLFIIPVLPCGFAEESPYALTVAGVTVTGENKADITGSGEYSYNSLTNTLTVNSAQALCRLQNSNGKAAFIYAGESLNLVLNGSSNVTVTGNYEGDVYGIYCAESLNILGEGSFTLLLGLTTAEGKNAAVYAQKDLTMENGAALTLFAGTGEISCGIFAGQKLTCNESSVTAVSHHAKNESYGVFAQSIRMNNAGVTAESGSAQSYSSGLYSGSGLTALSSHLNAGAEESSVMSSGIYAYGELLIDNSEVAAFAAKSCHSAALYTQNKADITDSTLSAAVDGGTTQAEGIFAGKGLNLENTEVSLSVMPAPTVYGIKAEDVFVNNCKTAELTVAGQASLTGAGVYADNKVTLENSGLSVFVKGSADYACGVYAPLGLLMTDGELLCMVNTDDQPNNKCYGVYTGDFNAEFLYGSVSIFANAGGTAVSSQRIVFDTVYECFLGGAAACSTVPELIKGEYIYRTTAKSMVNGMLETKQSCVDEANPRWFTVYPFIDMEQVIKTDYAQGDINADGRVSSYDARYCLRASVGLENPNEYEFICADIDGNGIIDSADARILLRISVQMDSVSDYKKADYYVKAPKGQRESTV